MSDSTHTPPPTKKRPAWMPIIILLVLLGAIGDGAYFYSASQSIYIENSGIVAPEIQLTPSVAGELQAVYVDEGEVVPANMPIARVGNEILKTQIAGEILTINKNLGASFGPTQPVATMLDPNELRVVGQLQEDKGLSEVKVGQRALFTVDAFSSQKYEGVVDEVSPTSREGDIVFNISDKRQVKEFNIKVRFDPARYPELKNGMSAKLWIYK